MSIVKLLVDFPNYSARKVRRLAQQLAYLAGGNPLQKGIAEDLMDYNLLKASIEQGLNDDVQQQQPLVIRMMEQDKTIATEQAMRSDEKLVTERICVVSVKEARRALEKLASFVNKNSDIRLNQGWEEEMRSCHGIINGSSFYTDRSWIDARTSPQADLPLEKTNENDIDDTGDHPGGTE